MGHRLLPLLLSAALAAPIGAAPAPQQPGAPPGGAEVQKPRNRLADETSPYLRQHAHNPVDWYPWGPEALALAKAKDKPIFLSIGYSACHWCHVMEHESFEDPAIAAVMNEQYVCIKVDREERPDLDEIYMAAVQALTGQGGWPMSVWLTPDLQPFFAGTYFPKDDAYGRPGFRRVLEHLGKAWQERRGDCVANAQQVAQHLQQVLQQTAGGELPQDVARRMREQSASRYDEQAGGFAAPPQYAPKFPHAAELEVLLRLGARGDAAARGMALATLDAMYRGGMYDQLGGGFHRYSTDRAWLVPHFEKMLYDNALLVPVYLDAHLLTGDAEYARVARETLDYMLRELQEEHGGFHSSQDADSEGAEGRFFVWTRQQFTDVLGDDAALAAARFGVTAAGNWEHVNVLSLAAAVADAAKAAGVEPGVAAARLDAARARLFAARRGRTAPATDDKVLTAWNAMAIAACARGYQVLGDGRYLAAAQRAAAFALGELRRDGRLFRSWHSGQARHQAYLEDQAFLADALMTLFETDFDARWLAGAKELLAGLVARFRDPADGAFAFTADDHEELLARSKSVIEASTPSGAAVAVRACLRGGLLLGDEELYGAGIAAMRATAAVLADTPIACPSLVAAWQFHTNDPREIVIAGAPDDARTQALLARVRRAFPTNCVVAVVADGNRSQLERLSPLFAGKVPVRGEPAAYVCRRGACELPVTEPERLRP